MIRGRQRQATEIRATLNAMWERLEAATEQDMRSIGARLAKRWSRGQVVYLAGPLGAGKTTLVRGVLESLGFKEGVRSPTFNLLQVFDTDPPVLHADLYRVKSYQGIGIEDYLETHLILLEWPDRADGLLPDEDIWRVNIDFAGSGRTVNVRPPSKLA